MIKSLVWVWSHLTAFISPLCSSLSLAVVRILRKVLLTRWPLGKQWWPCGSSALHDPMGEGTVRGQSPLWVPLWRDSECPRVSHCRNGSVCLIGKRFYSLCLWGRLEMLGLPSMRKTRQWWLTKLWHSSPTKQWKLDNLWNVKLDCKRTLENLLLVTWSFLNVQKKGVHFLMMVGKDRLQLSQRLVRVMLRPAEGQQQGPRFVLDRAGLHSDSIMVTWVGAGNHTRKVCVNWFNDFLCVFHQTQKKILIEFWGLHLIRFRVCLCCCCCCCVVVFSCNVEASRDSYLPIYLTVSL